MPGVNIGLIQSLLEANMLELRRKDDDGLKKVSFFSGGIYDIQTIDATSVALHDLFAAYKHKHSWVVEQRFEYCMYLEPVARSISLMDLLFTTDRNIMVWFRGKLLSWPAYTIDDHNDII